MNWGKIVGLALIVLGGLYLVGSFRRHNNKNMFISVVVIIVGLAFLKFTT